MGSRQNYCIYGSENRAPYRTKYSLSLLFRGFFRARKNKGAITKKLTLYFSSFSLSFSLSRQNYCIYGSEIRAPYRTNYSLSLLFRVFFRARKNKGAITKKLTLHFSSVSLPFSLSRQTYCIYGSEIRVPYRTSYSL